MMKIVFFCILLATVGSCNFVPDIDRTEKHKPKEWRNKMTQNHTNVNHISSDEWWMQFGCDELYYFISQKLKDNNDLLAAFARIEQAEASVKISGASLFPSVLLNYSNLHDLDDGNNTSNGGLATSYTLDIFGKIRNAKKSARATLLSSIYDKEALYLSIVSEVATSYFNLLSLNEQLDISHKNLNNIKETLNIMKIRFKAGYISEIDLAQQETLVYNREASLLELKKEREIAQNMLAILLGEFPENFKITSVSLNNIIIPTVPDVMPSEFIATRPDLASLEQEMIAANFDIAAARSAFFPTFTFSTNLLTFATNGTKITYDALTTLTSSLSMPLFMGGELKNNLKKASARQKELAINYRGAILTAFGEVENALYKVTANKKRVRSLENAKDRAEVAYNVSVVQFKNGAIDYLTLLTTQNSLFEAENSLIQARADQINSSIELFIAFGGGWKIN